MTVQMTLQNWIDRFLMPIDDPTSRLFHLNIYVAVVFVFIFLFYKTSKIKNIFNKKRLHLIFLNKKYWWNASTQTDYKLYALNSILKVFIFIPFLDFTYHISLNVLKVLKVYGGSHFEVISATTAAIFLFTLAAFVFDDFLRFLHHALMHKAPFLWKLHSVHHSATTLTPITLYRTHPAESAIATVRNSISLGVITGFFVFIFETQLTMTTLFGINFFGFLFNLLGSNLRHSQIPISFGWLEYIFISPKMHQVHHSSYVGHFEKNFGVSLSVWDKLMGTFQSSKNIKKLTFGL